MADVQPENGFTKLADELLEALARAPMPGRNYHRVVLALARLIYGWGKTEERIGSTQLARMTGLSNRAVRRVLADLVRWRVLEREETGAGKAPVTRIVKDYERWDWSFTPDGRESDRVESESDQRGAGCGVGASDERGSGGRTNGGPATRTNGGPTPYTERHSSERERAEAGAPLSLVAPAFLDPEEVLTLLGKQPGTREQKLAWFSSGDLELIALEAAKEADPKRRPGAWRAAGRPLVFRYWRQHWEKLRKSPPSGQDGIDREYAEREAREARWRAQRKAAEKVTPEERAQIIEDGKEARRRAGIG